MSLLRRSPAAASILWSMATNGGSPVKALNALVPGSGYAVEADIPYGSHPRHRLDVYRPTGLSAPAPVVLFFYGGGWRSGDRSLYRFVGQALASLGHVAVVPDYRLYPEVRFPAFVDDGAAAARWLRDGIAAHGGDPDRMILMGHSAGAHIAAVLALHPSRLADAGVPRSAIRGLIGLAGPYAFDPSGYERTRDIFAGTPDPETRPLAFVDADAPPALLLHGGEDTTVLPANAERLAAAIRAAGGSARHVIYPDIGHITLVGALAVPLRTLAPVYNEVAAFLATMSNPGARSDHQ